MTLVKKIATTAYATIKRLQGYQLLRNPSGSNPYQVNMIKYKRKLTPELDEVFYYTRVNRTFEGWYPLAKNKYLTSTHIFDTEKEQMTNKKNIFLHGTGILGLFRDKESVAESVLKKRKPLSLRKKNELSEKLNEKEDKRHSFSIKSNWDIVNEFLSLEPSVVQDNNVSVSKPKSIGFFKILKYNLSQVKNK